MTIYYINMTMDSQSWTIHSDENDDTHILSYLDNEQCLHHHLIEDSDEIEFIKSSVSGTICCIYDGNSLTFYSFNDVLNEIEEIGSFDVDIFDEDDLFLEYFRNDDIEYFITNADGENITVYYADNLMVHNIISFTTDAPIKTINFFADPILLIIQDESNEDHVFEKQDILLDSNRENENEDQNQYKSELYN